MLMDTVDGHGVGSAPTPAPFTLHSRTAQPLPRALGLWVTPGASTSDLRTASGQEQSPTTGHVGEHGVTRSTGTAGQIHGTRVKLLWSRCAQEATLQYYAEREPHHVAWAFAIRNGIPEDIVNAVFSQAVPPAAQLVPHAPDSSPESAFPAPGGSDAEVYASGGGDGGTAGPGMTSGLASAGNEVSVPVPQHKDDAPEVIDEAFWDELCKFRFPSVGAVLEESTNKN
jgi:hypothetical protein